jgi:hypothetical protein
MNMARIFIALFFFVSAARAVEYSGRVVDLDGNPVKGAKVYLVQLAVEQNIVTPAQLSDAEGNFSITEKNELKERYAFANAVVVAEGFGVGGMRIDKGKRLLIKLREATLLTVAFVDEEGRPVRDLNVRTQMITNGGGISTAWFFHPPKEMPILRGQTDGNGEVRLKNCPRGGRIQLAVDDERFAHLAYDNGILLSDEESMRAGPIVLKKGASISGRLVDETGKPGAGVRVAAQAISPASGGAVGVSDAEGFYHLKQLSGGNYNLEVIAKFPEVAPWTARAQQITLAAGEQRSDVAIKLIAGGMIRGKIVAEDNGEPIPEIHVGLQGPANPKNSGAVQMTLTKADGSFALRAPAGEQYIYIAMSSAPDGFKLPEKTDETVNLEDGKTVEVNFKLPRGPKIKMLRGRVVDELGKPAGECEVWVEPVVDAMDRMNIGEAYMVESAADGSFEFRRFYPHVKLRAKKDGQATAEAVELKEGEDREVALKLAGHVLSGVSGLVVDSAGDLLVGAKINLTEMHGGIGSGIDWASTKADGTFKIGDLWPDGWYSVRVSSKGGSEFKSGRLQLKPGEIFDLGKITLKGLDTFISGTVLDGNGNPAAGVQVTITGGKETPFCQVKTDKDGKFKAPVAAGDTLNIYATLDEKVIGHQRVAAGQGEIVLRPRGNGR